MIVITRRMNCQAYLSLSACQATHGRSAGRASALWTTYTVATHQPVLDLVPISVCRETLKSAIYLSRRAQNSTCVCCRRLVGARVERIQGFSPPAAVRVSKPHGASESISSLPFRTNDRGRASHYRSLTSSFTSNPETRKQH